MDVYDLDLRPSSRPPGRLFTGSRCFQSVRQTRRASRGRGTRPVDGSVRGDARDGSGRTTCDRFASTGERAIVKDRRPHRRQLPSADRVVYAANRNEAERRIPRSGSMKPCRKTTKLKARCGLRIPRPRQVRRPAGSGWLASAQASEPRQGAKTRQRPSARRGGMGWWVTAERITMWRTEHRVDRSGARGDLFLIIP
jgi:hypothetical protein